MEMESYLEFPPVHIVFWDYFILVLFFLTSLSIGIYQAIKGSKKKSTQEYLLANRTMSVLPVSMSQFASIFSANMLVNYPAEIAVFGTQSTVWFLGTVIAIPITVTLFTPIFYHLKIINVHEYLEKRFNKELKILVTILYILSTEINLAIYLCLPAILMNQVTGLHLWLSMCLIGSIGVIYTAIGGMKAVVWTDVLQMSLMALGVLSTVISGLIIFGDFRETWSIFEQHERVDFFNFSIDPRERRNFWSVLIGSTFVMLFFFATNQTVVQRSLCLPSLIKSQITLLLLIPFHFLMITLCALTGVMIFRQYHSCDPLKVGRAHRIEELFSLYVTEKMNIPGVPGFVFICVFSGALSSISSGLNAIAAIIYKDVLFIPCGKFSSQRREFNCLKLITLISGIAMILFTLVISQLGFLFDLALLVVATISGPIFAVFFLGIFIPWANSKGAFVGLLSGVCFGFWVSSCKLIYKPPPVGHQLPAMDTSQCFSMYGRNASHLTSVENLSDRNIYLNFTKATVETALNDASLQFINDTFKHAMENSTETVVTAFSSFQSSMMPLYQISAWLSATLFCMVTIVIGVIASFLTGCTRPQDVDPSLLSPLLSYISMCLPYKYKLRRDVLITADEPISLIEKPQESS